MKNKFINLSAWAPIYLIFMLTACHGDGKKTKSKQPTATTTHTDSLANRNVDIPTESTEAYVSGIISRRQAIEKQLPGINADAAARLYHSLSLYVDTALLGITGNEHEWVDEYVNFYSEAKGKVIPPAKVQQRINLLATAGIEPWDIGEGYTELRTVPAFYTGLFKTSLPADYSTYLQLRADEDTVLYSADAGLVIPFTLIGKRALNWEKFLDTYPNSIFAAAARELYERYCEDYLFGEDNTPSFEFYDKLTSLFPENKAEYIAFVEQHGNTKTAGVVKQFLDKVATAKDYIELRQQIRAAIAAVYAGEISLLPVQPEFGTEQIELLTKAVYDTVPGEIAIAEGATEQIDRHLDSVMYFQQDNNIYCVAIFANQGKGGGAPVSGWVDVWAFKKSGDRWQSVSHLLNAGGGGMYGNPGYFDKLVKVGNHTTGIVVSGGITHMGSSVSWDDLIAFKDEKLSPVMNIVTNDAYDGGKGMQRCSINKWWLQPVGGQENYEVVIISGSCIGGTLPLDRITVPYKNGHYPIPGKFQDKGI